MKRQKQIIVDPNTGDWEPTAYGETRVGRVDCPFCGIPAELVSYNGRLFQGDACEHAKGAVDAGNMQTAIHFEQEEK